MLTITSLLTAPVRVGATLSALQKDIVTLANDPQTVSYLGKTVPPAMQNLNMLFEQAGGIPESLQTSGSEESPKSVQGSRRTVRDGVETAKTVTDKIKKARDVASQAKTITGQLAKLTGSTGTELAERAASRVLGATARTAVRVVAGGLSATMEGLALTGPVGWIADAALAIPDMVLGVMWLVDTIQKAQHQAEFADNANPTLEQFGIPLPK
ncbi:hypothetical protein [Paraburkholderia humisilvae]|nr:hypothetical protein [Paraburkholderia humisilvae]